MPILRVPNRRGRIVTWKPSAAIGTVRNPDDRVPNRLPHCLQVMMLFEVPISRLPLHHQTPWPVVSIKILVGGNDQNTFWRKAVATMLQVLHVCHRGESLSRRTSVPRSSVLYLVASGASAGISSPL